MDSRNDEGQLAGHNCAYNVFFEQSDQDQLAGL